MKESACRPARTAACWPLQVMKTFPSLLARKENGASSRPPRTLRFSVFLSATIPSYPTWDLTTGVQRTRPAPARVAVRLERVVRLDLHSLSAPEKLVKVGLTMLLNDVEFSFCGEQVVIPCPLETPKIRHHDRSDHFCVSVKVIDAVG